MIASILRWFSRIWKSLFGKKSPRDFKPGEWEKFVKSFRFDQLSGSQKGVAFRQIMSFRK